MAAFLNGIGKFVSDDEIKVEVQHDVQGYFHDTCQRKVVIKFKDLWLSMGMDSWQGLVQEVGMAYLEHVKEERESKACVPAKTD